MLPAFKEVCRSADCINLMNNSCEKVHPCGHFCCGFRGEKHCLPCLHPDCVAENPDATRGKIGDDYCSICYTEGLSAAPSVMTKCGHI